MDIEEHKHRCLVRSIILRRLKDRDKAHQDLYGDDKRWPGYKEKNPQVLKDVLNQWKLGNRGNPGEWYDE